MSSFPCLARFVSGSGQVRYRLGDVLRQAGQSVKSGSGGRPSMVAEVCPSAKTCRELDRPGLLVGAVQLGKGGREPDQPGVVAGGDGGGPFDDGGGDRVVAGSVPA